MPFSWGPGAGDPPPRTCPSRFSPFPASLPPADAARRRQLGALAGLSAAAALGLYRAPAHAAEPACRLLVGYGAGGGADHVARLVADALSQDGSLTVVENRPGAAGQIALHEAARASAARPTLLLGTVGSVSIAPLLAQAQPLSLMPLAIIASTPHVLLSSASAPAMHLPALLEDARRHPGEIGYASLGIGSSAHLVGELLCRQAGVQMTHIPYPGSARAMTDLQGGYVPVLVSTLQASLPLMRQGRLRALAVTGTRRSALAPQVATFGEFGIAGMAQQAWYGVLAPSSWTAPQRTALVERLGRVLAAPALHERLHADGAEPVALTGMAAQDYLAGQREVWQQAVALVGARLG
ncbi:MULTISPECIES: Bug family tripartite tricarboxylate transporter substrate binding protein [Cupriavidus]|uniref:Bug family tripartite tricarboxylate transporter substrate binding protein n=1 Tax=Cupriavidus TaxID=106589 RepID=UPI0003732BDA|nr:MULTISPECIES: tripartite tricarboxylate transporter substrate binding protein [Cupriavidus]